MKQIIIAILPALITPLAAQVTSPSGYLTVPGEFGSSRLGAHSNSRQMHFDGEWRGTALQLTEVAYRLDFVEHDATPARAWQRVTLDVAECDMARITTVFDKNPLTQPTRVFDQAVVWPAQSGFPSNTLPPFGGVTGAFRFPFSRAYAYSGNNDLCLDYVFSGGGLINSGAWSPTGEPYALDSAASLSHVQRFAVPAGVGCTDGGVPLSVPSRMHLGVEAWDRVVSPPNLQGRYALYTQSQFTAPNRPVLLALGIGGSAAGIAIPGVTCARLHVNPTAPTIFAVSIADRVGFASTNFGTLPYDPGYVGLELWGQAAWSDTVSSGLSFTPGVSVKVPELPRVVRRAVVYQPDIVGSGRTTGLPADWNIGSNPLVRYR